VRPKSTIRGNGNDVGERTAPIDEKMPAGWFLCLSAEFRVRMF
jgi:hypothetical protein